MRLAPIPDKSIWDVVNPEPFHNADGNHFIKRLLMERRTASLQQDALAVNYFPALFEVSIGSVVGRNKVGVPLPFLQTKEDVSDIV